MAARAAFPESFEDFEVDDRVSFSKFDQKWILEDDDGSEWEFIAGANKWVPSLSKDAIEGFQANYGSAVDDDTLPLPENDKKRKNSEVHHTTVRNKQKKRQDSNENQPKERKNCAVYVSQLPQNVTVKELFEVFSKFGVVAEEIESGKPRIKLYFDENRNFKGDALVVYFRPESVPLAIEMLDDTPLRIDQKSSPNMLVKEADMSYKKELHKVEEDAEEENRERKLHNQKKAIARTQKLNNKLADWDDDDPAALAQTSSRWDQVVVLKYMFRLEEIKEEPSAILDIKDDIREECEKLGRVTKIVLFDNEPAGVVTVRFGNAEAASACVSMMNGRSFDGQRVQAYIYDGFEKFEMIKGDDDDEDGIANA